MQDTKIENKLRISNIELKNQITVLEKQLWEIGPFRNIAAAKDAFTTLQNEKYIRYDNLPLETACGGNIEVEFVSNVYFVDRTKVIQCNIRDVTEQKRAEKALQESSAR